MRTVKIEKKEEIFNIIRSCKTCFLAMCVENKPYVLPMNFALLENEVILHSAQRGRMWETLRKNKNVCITWMKGDDLAWQDQTVACSYRVKSKSVVAEGKAVFISEYDEKEKYLKAFMKQYSTKVFKFNAPAVKNVGIIKVDIQNLTAKEFGVKADTTWSR